MRELTLIRRLSTAQKGKVLVVGQAHDVLHENFSQNENFPSSRSVSKGLSVSNYAHKVTLSP